MLFHSRPTWVEINLSNIEHNITWLRKRVTPSKIIAVVKSNAYGHGLLEITKVCIKCGIRYLGVSAIEEGIEIRKNGIRVPILILGSIYPFNNFNDILHYNLTPTISSIESLRQLANISTHRGKTKLSRKIPIHLKIDTGMGRIGISPKNVPMFLEELTKLKVVFLEGVYTHFASADTNPEYTLYQLNLFNEVVKYIRKAGFIVPYIHSANSAAILKYPESYYTHVRPGLFIYGLLPCANEKVDTVVESNSTPLNRKKGLSKLTSSTASVFTKPALSWKTKIVFIKKVPKGKKISYGCTYTTTRPSIIATLPVGYADGYNRLLSNCGRVIIHNSYAPVIGRVTMDMIMVDITHITNARVGDEVVLIGQQEDKCITAEEIAKTIKSINYEVVCNINQRIPRLYLK